MNGPEFVKNVGEISGEKRNKAVNCVEDIEDIYMMEYAPNVCDGHNDVCIGCEASHNLFYETHYIWYAPLR